MGALTFYDYCVKNNTMDVLDQWHFEKNELLSPKQCSYSSHKKVWWRCSLGHEWSATIKSRSEGCGCPYCASRKVLVGFNDLKTTHPKISREWHPSRNGEVTPQSIVAGSHKKVWWVCEKGHEWQAAVYARANHQKSCPVCAGKVVVAGENDLESCFPGLAAQWHFDKNGDLLPNAITAYSNRKVWWRCELGHDYQATVGSRTSSKSGCPYCAGVKVLVGYNDLQTLHPKIAAQWHRSLNKNLTPQMITPGSNRVVWWECELGHVWKAAVFSRTGKRKHGCPVCAGKVKSKKKQSL